MGATLHGIYSAAKLMAQPEQRKRLADVTAQEVGAANFWLGEHHYPALADPGHPEDDPIRQLDDTRFLVMYRDVEAWYAETVRQMHVRFPGRDKPPVGSEEGCVWAHKTAMAIAMGEFQPAEIGDRSL